MKFSYDWLKRWVDLDVSVSDLTDRLTAAGLEVDGVNDIAAHTEGVVVGHIKECEPHPDADKLVVCKVDAGADELLQIVCGAPNARVGLVAPVAAVGGKLGEDFKIKKVKLRGVESFGMLCSAKELGMGEDHAGLLELSADAEPGQDIRDYLKLDDVQIDVDLTPNRADCLSIRGIARDMSAAYRAEFIDNPTPSTPSKIDDVIHIDLQSPEDCPRFAARIIRGIDPTAVTPLWMREALRRCGLRSISPVVDITNYVLLELGQPMHGFDFAKISGGIHVRRGRPGEQLVLLDEQEVDLDESVLAVCDDSGPVALGGIMGGMGTSVTDTTTDVLFEAAWFKPSTIMGKARDFGLHTDASHRFERGVDTALQARAIERATQLLIEIAGGEPGPAMLEEISEHVPQNQAVSLRVARLNQVLGTDISGDEVIQILSDLDMQVEPKDNGASIECIAPSSRFDIEIEEDLIEEVARIYGYDNIPEAVPSGSLAVGSAASHAVPRDRVIDTLCAADYQEVINYSFVDQKLLDTFGMGDGALALANPLSSDMAVMRTSLIPGLVANLGRNLRRQHARVRLFEMGVTFVHSENTQESEKVAAVVTGTANAEQWSVKGRDVDFYDVKGDVERLLALRGAEGEIEFRQESKSWTHPGASASVILHYDGIETVLGWCAVLHPGVLKVLDIGQTVIAFELDLKHLCQRDVPFAKIYSRFPSVRRDLALLVPVQVNYEALRSCVIEVTGDLLKNLVIFDVYEGQNLTKGYKSLAIGLIFQHVSSNLTDEAIDALVQSTVAELEQRLGARLRG